MVMADFVSSHTMERNTAISIVVFYGVGTDGSTEPNP